MLGGVEREDHREGAHDEDERHDGGERDAEDARRRGPVRVPGPQDPVGEQEPAERHRVRDEEDPHPDLARRRRAERRRVRNGVARGEGDVRSSAHSQPFHVREESDVPHDQVDLSRVGALHAPDAPVGVERGEDSRRAARPRAPPAALRIAASTGPRSPPASVQRGAAAPACSARSASGGVPGVWSTKLTRRSGLPRVAHALLELGERRRPAARAARRTRTRRGRACPRSEASRRRACRTGP